LERRPPFLGDREIVYVYFEWELKDSGLAWKAGWTRVLVLHTLLISHIALASSNTLKSMFTGARLQEHTSRDTLHSLQAGPYIAPQCKHAGGVHPGCNTSDFRRVKLNNKKKSDQEDSTGFHLHDCLRYFSQRGASSCLGLVWLYHIPISFAGSHRAHTKGRGIRCPPLFSPRCGTSTSTAYHGPGAHYAPIYAARRL